MPTLYTQRNISNLVITVDTSPSSQETSNPIKGKLTSLWTGPWIVEDLKNNTTDMLKMGNASRTVHVNHFQPLLEEDTSCCVSLNWVPPLFSHEPAPLPCSQECSGSAAMDSSSGTSGATRSGRVVNVMEIQ